MSIFRDYALFRIFTIKIHVCKAFLDFDPLVLILVDAFTLTSYELDGRHHDVL